MLFDSPAEPTTRQVREFIRSAITNFAPTYVISLGSFDYQFTDPITVRENVQRSARNLLASAMSRAAER